MLDEADKEKIKNEEQYRHEIREELNKNNQNKLWVFINSSIFLWFLSTVAVGSITYIWTSHQNKVAANRIMSQKKQDEENAKKIKIDSLQFEVEGRLSQFLVDVEPMVIKPYDANYSLLAPYTVANIRERWDQMKVPPQISHNVSNVYPEYYNRGIISLIIELDKLQKDMKISDNRDLRGVVQTIQVNAIFDNKVKNEFLPIYIEFNKKILKWKTIFPYMDCNSSRPFC